MPKTRKEVSRIKALGEVVELASMGATQVIHFGSRVRIIEIWHFMTQFVKRLSEKGVLFLTVREKQFGKKRNGFPELNQFYLKTK